jgi:hypothetical protein
LELVHCPGSSASAGDDSKDSTLVPSSPGEPSKKKGKRGQRTGFAHQVLERTREKRKGEFGGSYAMTRKALRHSEDQKVCSMMIGCRMTQQSPHRAIHFWCDAPNMDICVNVCEYVCVCDFVSAWAPMRAYMHARVRGVGGMDLRTRMHTYAHVRPHICICAFERVCMPGQVIRSP